MDRRYVCPTCGVKWFIPAQQPHTPDLTECAACGDRLVAFFGTTPDCVGQHQELLEHAIGQGPGPAPV
jgi:hypothetical protein